MKRSDPPMNLHEQVKLTAVFEPAPEGGFTSSFEELPEVFSEGETIEEAEANLFDALKLVMDYHREQSRRKPPRAVPSKTTCRRRRATRIRTRTSVKLNDLERHLRECGCRFEREGGNHTLWKNPANGNVAPVPRHREVKEGRCGVSAGSWRSQSPEPAGSHAHHRPKQGI